MTPGEPPPRIRTGYTREDVERLCGRPWAELKKRRLLDLLEEDTPPGYKTKIYRAESVERLRRALVKFTGLRAITRRKPVNRIIDAVYIPDAFVTACSRCGRPCAKMDVRRYCLHCGLHLLDWRDVFHRIAVVTPKLTFEV